MRRLPQNLLLIIAALTGIVSSACQSGGVGDPCVPEDEYRTTFSGYSATEVNVESRSFQCETRVCLVANFNGRVTCPYGQLTDYKGATDPASIQQALNSVDEKARCYLPGTGDGPNAANNNTVIAPVVAQKIVRPPKTAVYCSCRCNGPDKNVRYCECPSGYSCEQMVTDYGFGSGQLAGSYCVKDGTKPPKDLATSPPCLTVGPPPVGCGPQHPTGYD